MSNGLPMCLTELGFPLIEYGGVELRPVVDPAAIREMYAMAWLDLGVRSGLMPSFYSAPDDGDTWNGEVLGIVDRSSGEAVGFLRLGHMRAARLASTEIVVYPPHQGRKYASRAYAALYRYAFGALGLHRLEAVVYEYNTASVRLHDGMMTREGARREAVYWCGRYWDAYTYGILASEWSEAW